MDEREVYTRLSALLQQSPAGSASNDTVSMWLARVHAVVADAGQVQFAARIASTIYLKEVTGSLVALRDVTATAQMVVAALELRLPSASVGGFVGVGNAFDGMAAVGRVFSTAKISIRIVDPYMDDKVLSEFAVLAEETLTVELLTDSQRVRPALAAAIRAWKSQYNSTRKVQARTSTAGALHDRLVIVDAQDAYNVSQSLKDLAAKSPATIIRMDVETAKLKVAAYEAIWSTGTPIE